MGGVFRLEVVAIAPQNLTKNLFTKIFTDYLRKPLRKLDTIDDLVFC